MKRLVSMSLVLVVFVYCFTGCSRYLKEDNATTKYTTKPQSLSQTTTVKRSYTTRQAVTVHRKVTSTSARQVQETTEATTITPATATTREPYSVTTKYAGTSILSKTVTSIPYTENGEQKSVTVTVVTGFEDEMLAYINNERTNANKNTLVIDTELSRLATIRAAEASIRWSHTRPDGTSCFSILDTSPIRPRIKNAGENLAKNQTSVPQVMDTWMHSPGHRANILSQGNEYNSVGMAWVITQDGQYYWAQMFATIQ